MRINSNVRGAAEVISVAIARVHERLAPDVTRRLAIGEVVRFGDVELGPKGVAHAGEEPIAYASIASVELAGTRLRIKETGRTFAGVSLDTQKVANVVLFLDELRSRGVAVPELRPA